MHVEMWIILGEKQERKSASADRPAAGGLSKGHISGSDSIYSRLPGSDVFGRL